jgi:hypothetical protein
MWGLLLLLLLLLLLGFRSWELCWLLMPAAAEPHGSTAVTKMPETDQFRCTLRAVREQ